MNSENGQDFRKTVSNLFFDKLQGKERARFFFFIETQLSGDIMRLTIGKQLVAALVTVAVIFAGISTYIYVTVNDVEKGYDGLLNRSAPLVFEVKDVQTELYNQSAQVRAYLATGDKQSVVQYQESKARMNKLFDSLGTKLTTPEGKQQLQEVKTAVAAYQKVADESLVIRDSRNRRRIPLRKRKMWLRQPIKRLVPMLSF